jgi:hypothetical protein
MTKSLEAKFSSKLKVPPSLFFSFMRHQLSERCIVARLVALGYRISKSAVHRKLVALRTGSGSFFKPNPRVQKKFTTTGENWLKRQIRIHRKQSTRELYEEALRSGYDLAKRTVLRTLHSMKSLRLRKPRKQLSMNPQHKHDRLVWAQQCLRQRIDWSHVLFTDEKVWYLDGPTSRAAVWYDIQDTPPSLQQKGHRNVGVHIWGAFSLHTVPELVCLPETFDSQAYCQVLQTSLVESGLNHQVVLFHDRHPVHHSKWTTDWMVAHHVTAKLLPAKAADINPIENLWALVSRLVYPKTKTYNTVDELLTAIREAWANVQSDKELRYNLVTSMDERLKQVVALKGCLTGH